MKFFKKKTKEEEMAFRADAVLTQLTNSNDFEFTDLETIQILNSVKKRYIEHLSLKKSEFESKSTELQQKANEIENIIHLIK